MSTNIELLEAAAVAAQADPEWDQMPTLIVNTEKGATAIVTLDGDMFEALAIVGAKIKPVLTEKPTALLLYSEGWGISSRALGEDIDINKLAAELRIRGLRFSDHPASVETKMLTMIDDTGIYARHIERDNPEIQKLDSSGDNKQTGRVADHLTTAWMELTA